MKKFKFNTVYFISLAFVVNFSQNSCKSSFFIPKKVSDNFTFKIYHDNEVLIVNTDSTYIQNCIDENPEILIGIVADNNMGREWNGRDVNERSFKLGTRLMELSYGKDSVVKYLLCAKPDGVIALSRLLSTDVRIPNSKLKEIQHMAHDIIFEVMPNAACLECFVYTINITHNGTIGNEFR